MQNEQLQSFFRGDYMPHGHCYLWQPHILWTNVVADLVIAASYFSIPIAIMMFANKRKDIGYNKVFALFSLFILCCGITHVFGIITIWQGVYGAHGIAKAITALVSLVTAIYVFKLMPNALAMPTIQQFAGVRDQLKAVSESHSSLESQLKNSGVFKFMIEAMPLGAVLVDDHFNIQLVNKTLLKDFGFSSEALLGKPLSYLFTSDGHEFEKLQQALKTVVEDNPMSSQSLILKGKSKHGDGIPIEVSIVKEHADGTAMILVSIKNLTHFRYLENQILESHQRLERAISATNDGIWEWNIATGEVSYSPQLMILIGQEQHIEHPEFAHWKSHIHPDFVELVEFNMQRHFDHGEKYEVEYIGLNKKGEYGWFLTRGDTLFDANNKPRLMSGSLSYIEEKKHIQEELKEKQRYLTNIIDNAICGIFVFNFDQQTNTQINQRYTDITGYNMEDIATLPSLMELFHPDDIGKVMVHIEDVIAVGGNEVSALQYRLKHKSGRWIWCYSFDSVLSRDANGEPLEMLGTFIDITDLKNNADKLTESNEYLERFAYVASHDLQEPLRKITAFSDSLHARLVDELEGDAAYELDRLKDAASRMRVLIQDVLSLSKINVDSVNKQQLPFSHVLNQVQDNLSFLIAESQTEIMLKQDATIYVDSGLMTQLIQNLIQNSIKFRQADLAAKIIISIQQQIHTTLIQIHDNGIGMDSNGLQQIFEPFKRLVRRDQYEGSGIGLAISKQIVKVHGGTIHCTSKLGEGTQFMIELPNA
ncbi:PAS domain S-box protein [Alteromonadaceae bacterium BrNp21-10]|nr:PAS domain S-box protein [Alteromonadaceae bacterium BrNp21-10]